MRVAAALKYTFLRTEYWLSHGGILREYARLSIYTGVILTLLAILIVPPVTAILTGVSEWTALSAEIVQNITNAVMALPPIVLGVASLLILAKVLRRHWHRRRGEQRYRQEELDGY